MSDKTDYGEILGKVRQRFNWITENVEERGSLRNIAWVLIWKYLD